MKKQLLLLFGGLLLAAPAMVQAQVNYAISGNTAYVTYSMAGGNVVITNTYEGYPVTSIGEEAFQDCYSLTNVTLPDSVNSIGVGAFFGSGLRSITIPNSVTSIGGEAFNLCYSLTNIAVDAANPNYSSTNGVLFDKDQAALIQYPLGLTHYTIPNSVTSIGDYAFDSCMLTNVTIGNNVTSIGQYAFVGCPGLTSVTMGNSVTRIGNDAFNDCQTLTSVTIGSGVTGIGGGAFAYCHSLTSVTIPDSVTNIGDDAFLHCYNLTNVAIPDSVTSIGNQAFGYSGLTSVTIPDSVTSIGGEAFAFSSLTDAYFQGNAPPDGGFFFEGDGVTVYYLPGTTGWGTTFGSMPTAPWTLPYPLILNHNASFGVQNSQFGFTISWATNLSIVVEACTNLANPVWTPLATNVLVSGTNYFSDPQWTNFPMRFYRAACANTVGGSLTGLPAFDTVTLQDNGSDTLRLSANGRFTFPTALPNGQSYSVTVSGTSGLNPMTCTITNGSGTVSGANATNVLVQCTFTGGGPELTGNKDLDMYNAAVADGTANGGVPAVMLTENGGAFRVTALGPYSANVCEIYSGWSVFTQTVGSSSCSSTTFPSGTWVIQFGTVLECGFGPDGY